MADELIGIVLFVGIFTVIGMIIVFRSRTRRDQQDTIRLAIEKGRELTPEVIEKLGAPPAKSRDRDLRGALIALAVGFGFISLGFAVPDDEATRVMAGVASFPILIGLALLAMYFLRAKEG